MIHLCYIYIYKQLDNINITRVECIQLEKMHVQYVLMIIGKLYIFNRQNRVFFLLYRM